MADSGRTVFGVPGGGGLMLPDQPDISAIPAASATVTDVVGSYTNLEFAYINFVAEELPYDSNGYHVGDSTFIQARPGFYVVHFEVNWDPTDATVASRVELTFGTPLVDIITPAVHIPTGADPLITRVAHVGIHAFPGEADAASEDWPGLGMWARSAGHAGDLVDAKIRVWRIQ